MPKGAKKVKEAPKYERPTADTTTLANKKAHGVARTWTIKKGATVPDKWDGKTLTILVAKPGATPEESVANILAFCTDHVAFVDRFNAAHMLDVEKGVKEAVLAFPKEATLEEAQTFCDGAVSTPNTKGRTGGAKVTVKKARETVQQAKSTMDEMLAAMPEEAREAWKAKIAALNL